MIDVDDSAVESGEQRAQFAVQKPHKEVFYCFKATEIEGSSPSQATLAVIV